MKREKLNGVIDFRDISNKKKYFLVVSDDEFVLECWAKSHIDLMGIVNIYDDEENPHKVSLIVDVEERHIYEVIRKED